MIKIGEEIKPDYYDPYRTITKNRVLNFILGARSIGKTYGFKKFLLSQAIKGKGQFMYLRRTQEQVKTVTNFFGEVINEPEFDGYVFKQQSNRLYAAKEVDIDNVVEWKEIGIMQALSVGNKVRSIEYPGYKYLLFDEFLPENISQFYKEEVSLFLDIIFTVFRNRDFQVFALSNATMLHNDYFDEFNVKPNVFQEYTYAEGDKNRDVLVQILKPSDNWNAFMNTTPMGRLVKGTSYEDFALGNKFKDNNDTMVEDKPSDAENVAIFKIEGRSVGVWVDKRTNYVFISEDYNPTVKMKFGFYPEDTDEENKSYYDLYDSRVIDYLLYARRNNILRFTTTKAKSYSKKGLEKMRIL